jgi:hypothetical protein
MKDKHGHGTRCTALLIRTAPNIDLYIARVFTDSGTVYNSDYHFIAEVGRITKLN